MSRWTVVLLVVLLAGAGGVWWWTKSTTEQVTTESAGIAAAIPPAVPGRGPWHAKYHREVAELEGTRETIRKLPDATPEIIADVDRTVAIGLESRWRGAVKQQLQSILIAFRGHESAFRRLGPDPSTTPEYFDKNGRLLVSWRVHLLGYLGERPLLDHFRLNEPWDSPHNKPLLARMPDVFRAVDEPDDSTTTRFVVLDGPGSLFEGGQFRSLKEVSDPVSETMMLAMLPRERAVPWTKPEDALIDPAEPLRSFEPMDPRGFEFMTVEGALLRWRPQGTPAQFLALLSFQGGEPEGTLQEMFRMESRPEAPPAQTAPQE